MGTKEIQKRVDAFSQACRRYGVKATHQRREIYRELAGTNDHPNVETIYDRVRKRIPEISLDTVYRTLHLLEKKGLIGRVGFLGDKTRFDANTDRHHHFVCTECGFMGDFYHEQWNNFRARGEATRPEAGASGKGGNHYTVGSSPRLRGGASSRLVRDVQAMGTVKSIYVELRGLCRACQAKRHEKKK